MYVQLCAAALRTLAKSAGREAGLVQLRPPPSWFPPTYHTLLPLDLLLPPRLAAAAAAAVCQYQGDAVRHINLFQMFAAVLCTLAEPTGGEAGLLQSLPPPHQLCRALTNCFCCCCLSVRRGDAVRHIDVFQTFAVTLRTLAESAGGEAGCPPPPPPPPHTHTPPPPHTPPPHTITDSLLLMLLLLLLQYFMCVGVTLCGTLTSSRHSRPHSGHWQSQQEGRLGYPPPHLCARP